jgi:DNA-binding CsgD family transcriptional regulator
MGRDPRSAPVDDALARGRAAFERDEWSVAYRELSEADRREPLAFKDLERCGVAAYLVGLDDAAFELWTRAYGEAVRGSDAERAGGAAFWLGFALLDRGEVVRGGGWLARAAQHADEAGVDTVVHGYLLVTEALQRHEMGDFRGAYEAFTEAGRLAARAGEVDLATLAKLGCGDALIALGDDTRGIALLDDAMVAVTAGEVGPVVMGIVYCATIETCQRRFDLARAREWTAALSGWCEAHPDLVPYRGQCLVYRADLMTLRGAWAEAFDEVTRAAESTPRSPVDPVAGEAWYRRAELHRLRGETGEAEAAYREAHRLGRAPQPGLALLRLEQGRVAAAASSIGRTVAESDDPRTRPQLLDAQLAIAVAGGDLPTARDAADELAAVAAAREAPLLDAMSARAAGSIRLAEGDPTGAVAELRRSLAAWQAIDAPYEAARTRVLLAEACRAIGEDEAADLELDAARRTFEELGARPDLDRIASRATPSAAAGTPGGLTARELEVLRLVAEGKSNRAIAGELVISEKTVARHVANIFLKLDVSSRSAATAYAYRHHLVVSPT